jgi:CRISPR/Cas system-associated exonuclease Cas4 (RecB family)
MTAPMPISPSSAETFRQCKRKYALEFFDIQKVFSENLHFGSAIHSTFQHLVTQHQKTKSWLEPEEAGTVLSGFLRDFRHDQIMPPQNELEQLHMQWLETGIRKIYGFLQHIAPLIEQAQVLNTEHWIKLDLLDPHGTVRVTGRVDLIIEMPDSEIWVIDFKSGKIKDAISQSLPLALYSRAAQLEYPNQTIRAFEAYLEPYEMLEYNTERIDLDLEQLSRIGYATFLEKDFPAEHGVLCAYCDFFKICHPNEHSRQLPLKA